MKAGNDWDRVFVAQFSTPNKVMPEGNKIWVLGDGVGRHTIFGYCGGGTDHKLLAHTVPASGCAGRLAIMTNKELATAITKNNVKASR